MKPIAWIVGGFALTGLAAVLENLGELGSSPAARLPTYLPALFILLGGQYCLWRGVRSGVVAIWSGAFDRSRKPPVSDTPQSACRTTDDDPAGGFDADAVFARYLEQREADQANSAKLPGAPIDAQPAGLSFGRRII